MLLFFLQVLCFAQEFVQTQIELTQELKEQAGPYTWDFGEIQQGEIVKHSFTIENKGEKTLNIKGVDTSCGCTAFVVEEYTLLPGESTEIEIAFNSKGYTGAVTQYAYVRTDNPKELVIKLTIKAEVVK